MSDTEDDTDFIIKTAERTERFVVEHLKSVRNEMRRMSDEIGTLESELKTVKSDLHSVEQDNVQLKQAIDSKHCSCDETVKGAFAAGLAAIDQNNQKTTTGDISDLTPEHSQCHIRTSTPNAKTVSDSNVDPGVEGMVARKLPTTFQLALKRKAPPTFRLIDRLDALDTDMRTSITPFYNEDKKASSDFLNHVQRAFIKYRSKFVLDNEEPTSNPLVMQIIREGVQHGIWPPDFHHEKMKSTFHKYIVNRIKNEKKNIVKKSYLDNQSARLSSMMSTADDQENEEMDPE